MNAYRDLKDLIARVAPRLVDRVYQIVEESEKEYTQRSAETQDGFLWEHTLHVAAITRQICHREDINPIASVMAALFHDAGKFQAGEYHKGEIPEEEVSASLAQKCLTEEGMDENLIKEVVEGLNALYSAEVADNRVANVVHDADFLAKMGHLGVANFFIKGTLRGQNLERSLTQSLSQELTYASVLPENMCTRAGRELAEGKSRISMRFFRELLIELRDHGIGRFKIVETAWPCPTDSKRMLRIRLVLPEECPECGGNLITEHSSEKGIKCTELLTDVCCGQCLYEYRISFCLPEICR